jgi:hypothetical protein
LSAIWQGWVFGRREGGSWQRLRRRGVGSGGGICCETIGADWCVGRAGHPIEPDRTLKMEVEINSIHDGPGMCGPGEPRTPLRYRAGRAVGHGGRTSPDEPERAAQGQELVGSTCCWRGRGRGRGRGTDGRRWVSGVKQHRESDRNGESGPSQRILLVVLRWSASGRPKAGTRAYNHNSGQQQQQQRKEGTAVGLVYRVYFSALTSY